jgi:hypothetical protein
LLGKLNVSRSSNSQGAFVDGNYHEFVVGSAYRPVDNDRWNTLFKYTNLNNVPTAGQLTPFRPGSRLRAAQPGVLGRHDLRREAMAVGRRQIRLPHRRAQDSGGRRRVVLQPRRPC